MMMDVTEPRTVADAFGLNYNLGIAVVELLTAGRRMAIGDREVAEPLRAALMHLVREMQRLEVLPSHEKAAHAHKDAEDVRTYLRGLAEDLVNEVREGTDVDQVRTVEGALRGLVVKTHQRSRAELTGAS